MDCNIFWTCLELSNCSPNLVLPTPFLIRKASNIRRFPKYFWNIILHISKFWKSQIFKVVESTKNRKVLRNTSLYPSTCRKIIVYKTRNLVNYRPIIVNFRKIIISDQEDFFSMYETESCSNSDQYM